jgi:hypothetical protein
VVCAAALTARRRPVGEAVETLMSAACTSP